MQFFNSVMLDKDTLIQKTLLSVSPNHANRYAQLPVAVQEKIRDIIFKLAEHHQIINNYHQDYEIEDEWDEIDDDDYDSPEGLKQLFSSSLQSHDGILPLSQSKSVIASDDQTLSSSNNKSKTLQRYLKTFPENAYTDDLEVLEDGHLKLDITSTRESVYAGMGCMGPIILFIGFMSEITMFYYIGIFTFIWGIKQASRTDDFLKFIQEKNEIFYHRQSGKKILLSSYLKLDEVLYIAVQGSQNSSKESRWWEYKPIAITTNGTFLDLGDQKKSDYVTCFAFTRKLAEMWQVNFFNEFQPEAELKVTMENSEIEVYYSS